MIWIASLSTADSTVFGHLAIVLISSISDSTKSPSNMKLGILSPYLRKIEDILAWEYIAKGAESPCILNASSILNVKPFSG